MPATGAARLPSSYDEDSRRGRHGGPSGAGQTTRADLGGEVASAGAPRTTSPPRRRCRVTTLRAVERPARNRHGPGADGPVTWAPPWVGGGLGWDQRGATSNAGIRTGTCSAAGDPWADAQPDRRTRRSG